MQEPLSEMTQSFVSPNALMAFVLVEVGERTVDFIFSMEELINSYLRGNESEVRSALALAVYTVTVRGFENGL